MDNKKDDRGVKSCKGEDEDLKRYESLSRRVDLMESKFANYAKNNSNFANDREDPERIKKELLELALERSSKA